MAARQTSLVQAGYRLHSQRPVGRRSSSSSTSCSQQSCSKVLRYGPDHFLHFLSHG